jgi:hypothetical protein
MEKTKEEIAGIVDRWEDSGLLTTVPDPQDKAVVALNLEAAATDLVVQYSNKYGGTAITLLFPIILRINKKYGFRPISKVRQLYIDLNEDWEYYILQPETEELYRKKADIEAEFCPWFVETRGNRYW